MEQNQNSSLFQLNLDAQNSYTLRSAASWAKVLGIVGLIMGVLFVVFGIMAPQLISSSGYDYQSSGVSRSTVASAGMVVYILFGLIFIVPSIFALNAGNKITNGLRANDQGTLNAGFAGARNYFAFWAIMMILMLIVMLISLLSVIGAS